jgi:DNA polymerase III epsilon subunit-like protein
MKTFTIFDTETTGLFNTKDKPKQGIFKARNPMLFPEDYPRIFQIAWIRMKEDGTILEEFSEFIKPDGWVIPTGPGNEFWADHGYSTEECERIGIPIETAMEKFALSLHDSDYLVAHNIDFDKPVTIAELARAKTTFPEGYKKPKILCTMKTTINFVNAPHSKENQEKWAFLRGKPKFPKLEELHDKLFSCGFDGAHDALNDVRATFRCLKEIKKLGLINY